MDVVGLSIFYILSSIAVLWVCLGVGNLLWPLRPPFTPGTMIDLLISMFVGLASLSTWATVLGLFGLLHHWAIWPPFLVAGTWGSVRLWRAGLGASTVFESVRRAYRRADTSARIAAAMTAAACGLIVANTVVGGLHPDHGQDAMWYHITVPLQWVLRGDVAMFPHCMPSTYTLACEVIYAVLLTLGNEILVTCFHSLLIVVGIAIFPAVAWTIGGGRTAILAAATGSVLQATNTSIAPVGALNETFASTALFATVWLMIAPTSREPEHPTPRAAIVGGVLGGFAVMVKAVAVGFLLPATVISMFVVWRRSTSIATLARTLLLFAAGVLAASLPWLIRAVVECGNPLIHVAPTLLPTASEMAPVLDGYAAEPRRLISLSAEGIAEAISPGLRLKIVYASVSSDGLFFILPVFALITAKLRRTVQAKAYVLVALACAFGLFVLSGYQEVVRYFAVCYAMLAPVLAWVLAEIARSVRGPRFCLLVALLLATTTGSYAFRQARWATMHTIQWKFHPVVTEAQLREFATHTEFGPEYTRLRDVRDFIPADAVVLVPDSRGPFALHRRTWWSDFSCRPILDVWWRDYDPLDPGGVLRSHGVDYVLQVHSDAYEPRLDELERIGVLRPLSLPDPIGQRFRLFRVGDGSAEEDESK